jgi:hypothetical protein
MRPVAQRNATSRCSSAGAAVISQRPRYGPPRWTLDGPIPPGPDGASVDAGRTGPPGRWDSRKIEAGALARAHVRAHAQAHTHVRTYAHTRTCPPAPAPAHPCPRLRPCLRARPRAPARARGHVLDSSNSIGLYPCQTFSLKGPFPLCFTATCRNFGAIDHVSLKHAGISLQHAGTGLGWFLV